MPTPSPGIDELLRTQQFGGAPASAAPLPAAAPASAVRAAPPMAPPSARPQATASAPPNMAAAIMAALGQLGAAPPAAPLARAPVPQPAPATPQRPALPVEAHDLLAKALGDRASDSKALWLSAEDLEEFGIDAETLPAVLAPMGLHALPNFGSEGGVLLARSPSVLEAAERARDQGRIVPIIPVRGRQAQGMGRDRGRT